MAYNEASRNQMHGKNSISLLLSMSSKGTCSSIPMTDNKSAITSFSIFSFLWAAAVLFHLISSQAWFRAAQASPPQISGIIQTALAISAVYILFRPWSVMAFLVLSLLQVIDVIHSLPAVPNHWLLPFFVNLTFLFSLPVVLRQKKSLCDTNTQGGHRGEQLYWEVNRSLRLLVIIFYFFAFFSKLNSDFVNIERSCAVQFYGHIVQWFPFFPQFGWTKTGVIYATLVGEGLLPALLFFPRTRLIAVLLGAVFHFLLAFDVIKHFFDFSSVMFALLFVFVPRDFFELKGELSKKLSTSEVKTVNFGDNGFLYFRVLFLIGLLVVVISGFGIQGVQSLWVVYFKGRLIVWFFYGTTVLFVFIRALFRYLALGSHRDSGTGLLSLRHWIMPALVFVNGLGPYLGFKTRSAWQMYGNLRMESKVSNHFLIPKSFDIAGFLSDTVVLAEISDPRLRGEVMEKGLTMTYFEFVSFLTAHPEVTGLYIHNGTAKKIDSKTLVPNEGHQTNIMLFFDRLERKLFWFQPIGDRAGELCLW